MKKITKFLDSVMGGIKRTCVAKALAVFAVASIAINVNAQTDNNQTDDDLSGVTSVDGLKGKTQDYLFNHKINFKEGETKDNFAFPTDYAQHFFLYNVKTGRFLNFGGYWGTHASLKEYGEPLAIVVSDKIDKNNNSNAYMQLVMEMDGTEGKYVGWVGVPVENDHPDVGVFVDRKFGDVIGWQLVPVEGKINTYRLYTYAHDQFDPKHIVWDTTKKYYLCSNMGATDVDVNCGAISEDDIANYKEYDEWRFLSYEQIRNLQDQIADNMKDALELSFKLRCPGFSRGDNDIKKWNTYNFQTGKGNVTGSDGFALYGLSEYYNYIAGSETKPSESDIKTGSGISQQTIKTTWTNTLPKAGYEFEGTTYKDLDNYKRHLAKYYTASITNKRGIVYQDVEISIPGRYQIECKGYSTTKMASLFACVLDSDNSTMIEKAKKTTLNQVSNMSQEAKDALHVKDKNVDYAGKNFYGSRQYINTVYVTVTDEDMKDGKATIRFGIMVGDQNDTNVKGDEWTVFDDFRILYAANNVEEDLILDEMRGNLSYLVNCPTPMENKTLHLNKTFTLNKWNSFILPVNLNKTQVLATFGANARLAKLTRLTDTGIEFTSVDLLDDDSKPAIEAYVPYIIFPRKGADQTEAYTANYLQNGQSPLNIKIAANHYVIGKVSMPLTTTEGVKANDWSKMDKEKWTTTKIGGNDQIKAYGTFARTFGKATQDDDKGTWTFSNKEIFKDRDNLIGSYFFDNGNMYHSNKSPRGLRGFSCWFRTDGAHKSLKFTLDGVTQSGTTGIEDILADYEQPVSRFANGVYNMNGQLVKQGNSTAGLPSGMYIVNGKKCIVR